MEVCGGRGYGVLWCQGKASHTHRPYLIIYVVLVGMVLVKDQLKKLPHSIHVDRLEFPGFAACLFVVTQRDIAGRKVTPDEQSCSHSH